jgi:uncharacterized protein YegL
MAGAKLQSLNFAIRECIPEMQAVARENPECQMLIRVLTFSSGARWLSAQPTPVEQFTWQDIQADGVTDMGRAMELLADALSLQNMGERALPPVLVLVTDGQPTDDFAGGLKKLMDQPWAKKAVRVAIGCGEEPHYEVLDRFIAHPEFKALRADNAPTLARYIKWASTALAKTASAPASQPKGTPAATGNVPIPIPPIVVPNQTVNPTDVW